MRGIFTISALNDNDITVSVQKSAIEMSKFCQLCQIGNYQIADF